MSNTHPSPVRLEVREVAGQPAVSPGLVELYRGFEEELLVPLWYDIGNLMPFHPVSRAAPHVWRWRNLIRLA